MNLDLTPLKTYINAQRNNGVADEVISNSLISSGWQPDMVAQALAERETPVTEQPPVSANLAPNSIAGQGNPVVVGVSQASNNLQQPDMVSQAPITDKYRKKVKTIGIIMIALGVLAFATNVYPSVNTLPVMMAVAQVLIGIGVMQYKKIAYTLFNIVAIISILFGVLMVWAVPLMFLGLMANMNIFMLVATLVSLVLSIGQLVFYIYGGIFFHKQEVRALFGKK